MGRPALLLRGTLVAGCLITAASAVTAQDAQEDFRTTDRNGDGAVDAQEYRLRMVEVFYLADKNKDSSLTLEELQSSETVDVAAYGAADANGNGVLLMQEFVEYRMTNFSQADANKDGKLTADEVSRWNTSPR
jgi:Ca2+-binding EF-hand superfamily protein